MVKNLSAMQETQETEVQFLGQEEPWKKGMAIHSSILVWRMLWTEETGGAMESHQGVPTVHGVTQNQT